VLKSKTYSDGTPPVNYSYDVVGRLLTAANGTDTLTWSYDLAGQMLSEQSSRNSSIVAYTYDAAGNRLTLNLDGSRIVTYGYDDDSRVRTITRISRSRPSGRRTKAPTARQSARAAFERATPP
jgi:YD repeat-containing protein